MANLTEAEAEEIAEELKHNIKVSRAIANLVKKLRQQEGYFELREKISECKETLYDYMMKNDLEKFGDYLIGFCKPYEVKKEERIIKKREELTETLEEAEITPDKIAEIIERLTV